MIRLHKNIGYLLIALSSLAIQSHAALTWPNCLDIKNSDFKTDTLVKTSDGIAEPMKMAFDLLAGSGEDAKDKVDVYFTERLGKVRKFDSKSSKVLTIATIALNIDEAGSSDGVLGIALDPSFKTNNYVYIYYTFVAAEATGEKSWRVSRFTLNAAHDKLDLTTEAVVLKIPIISGSKHPGGALQFDSYGDLWITTGNDYRWKQVAGGPPPTDFPLYSSPNTNDLRGKILRIHPTPNGTYTIPAGNLFPSGTASTKPEIYIMGTRNAYTLALDPVRRWVLWGDIGPDAKNMDGGAMNSGGPENTEEYDLAQSPGNYGFPFFSGDFASKPGAIAGSLSMPADYTWEGLPPGLVNLPPAISPIHAYKKSCAISGPLYRYNGDLKSSIKFPPHFNRKWLVSDFNGHANVMTAFTLADNGKSITAQENVIGAKLDGPLDIESGPDGALYVVNYAGYRTTVPGTNIIRISYTGTCSPAEPKLETSVSIAEQGNQNRWMGPDLKISQAPGLSVLITSSGAFTLKVLDILGRAMATRWGHGEMKFTLPEINQAGIYFLSVQAPEGRVTRKFIRK
jgi:cytochrome c